jgi:hypothetical protein
MSGLSDAERDAGEVVRLLAGLSLLLDRRGLELGEESDVLAAFVRDGGAAAARVLAYLRGLRGPGDGYAVAVPPRLGPWRDWVPPRGPLFGAPRAGGAAPIDGLPRRRPRKDPGE